MIHTVLTVMLVILGLCMAAVLVCAVRGPRFTDRVIAINAINTLIICVVCLLSAYLNEDYLVDVALIYALLGFLVNTLLMRQLLDKHSAEKKEGKNK